MNSALEGLLERLPESPTPLTQDNRRNIATYIPVPNDYEVLWADIQSFGGYPAGVVVADKCLIVKSTKEAVKERAKDIKANNKNLEKKDRAPVPKDLYRIIPGNTFLLMSLALMQLRRIVLSCGLETWRLQGLPAPNSATLSTN